MKKGKKHEMIDYWKEKEERKKRAVLHTDDMYHLYMQEITESIQNTLTFYRPKASNISNKNTEVKNYAEVWDKDTVSAILSIPEGTKVCALNFASFKNPGGMYLNGSSAQEECLCAQSTLYNVLKHFNDGYYEWNRKNLNKGMYHNRMLYSPDILFGEDLTKEDSIKRKCDIITCASPNWSVGKRYHNFTYEENLQAMKSRIDFIVGIVEHMEMEVCILGAFGCGVFRQKPKDVARLFKERIALNATGTRFIFAIPKSVHSENYEIFQKILQSPGP